MIAGGAQIEDRPDRAIAVAARAAPWDLDRWADEGGSVMAEAAARVH